MGWFDSVCLDVFLKGRGNDLRSFGGIVRNFVTSNWGLGPLDMDLDATCLNVTDPCTEPKLFPSKHDWPQPHFS